MRILVWGLGYVGTVSAACLAQRGHEVVGIEPNADKVEALNRGDCLVTEPGLAALVHANVGAGRLRAAAEGRTLIAGAAASLICVGTPSAADGSTQIDQVCSVAREIGLGLRDGGGYHTVIVRSTVPPGTTRRRVVRLVEESSGRVAGTDFGAVMNPEFLREATAIADFEAPPYTIIGELDRRSGDTAAALYDRVPGDHHRVALEEAEVLKLVNNAFHALKVTFANEIGRFCHEIGVDGHDVMRLVCADRKLNISPAYLRPGFAFGGSCLPKDLRALVFSARRRGVTLPVLEAVLPSNRLHVESARRLVQDLEIASVAILGLSFKPGTDDLRESPIIDLVRDLWRENIDVAVHDPDVDLGRMIGGNRRYLERQLPQIRDILHPQIDDALRGAAAVVIAQERPAFREAAAALPPGTIVIDLVHFRCMAIPASIQEERSWSPAAQPVG
jgi:GDP-mannose 6-dehydrogenase